MLKKVKKMPFTRDDYFKMLDGMLGVPNQPDTGNSLVNRLRQTIFKRQTKLPRI